MCIHHRSTAQWISHTEQTWMNQWRDIGIEYSNTLETPPVFPYGPPKSLFGFVLFCGYCALSFWGFGGVLTIF